MPDLKKMNVQELRALARKVLGTGASRLKTKADLVRALEQAEGRVAAATSDVVRAAKAAGEKGRAVARAARSAAQTAIESARQAMKGAGGRRPGKKPEPSAPEAPGADRGAASGLDPEGFFVARVRGEEAARGAPHPMVESGGAPEAGAGRGGAAREEEGLGDLPSGYGDDAFVAIPRDPKTLFLYWDHSSETLADAFAGLDEPRAQLWIMARAGGAWERVRALDLAIESHGYYVHDLEPGRSYRAEIHTVDRRGRDRMVARPSNEVVLPSVGPSSVVDDRFARIPWDVALGQVLGPGRPGGPFSEEARAILARLSDWTRFGATWGGSAGGMGGRPFSPIAAPSSPARGPAEWRAPERK